MVDDELRDYPESHGMSFTEKLPEIPQLAVIGMDAFVVGDIISVVP